MRRALWITVIACLGIGPATTFAYLSLPLPPADAVPEYEVIASSGDPAPEGWNDPHFGRLRSAVVDPDTGEVAFIGAVQGSNFSSGIWVQSGDQLRLELLSAEFTYVLGPGDEIYHFHEFERLVAFTGYSILHVALVGPQGGDSTRGFFKDQSGLFQGQAIGLSDKGSEKQWIVDDLRGVSRLRGDFVALRLSGPDISDPSETRIYDFDPYNGFLDTFEPIASTAAGFANPSDQDGTLSPTPVPLGDFSPGAAFLATVTPNGGTPEPGIFQPFGTPYRIWDGRAPAGTPQETSITITGEIASNRDHAWTANTAIHEPGRAEYQSLVSIGYFGSWQETFSDVRQLLSVGDAAPWAGQNAIVASIGPPAIGSIAEIVPRSPLGKGGLIQAVSVRVNGPGIDDSNDETLLFFDRVRRPFVLAREGTPIHLSDGTSGLVTHIEMTPASIDIDDAVTFILELDGTRDVVVRTRLVDPPPVPAPSTPPVAGAGQ
ncbi:MAG: hypothetical protein WA771_04715, partial [Chthoniobacterales bacterium]